MFRYFFVKISLKLLSKSGKLDDVVGFDVGTIMYVTTPQWFCRRVACLSDERERPKRD